MSKFKEKSLSYDVNYYLRYFKLDFRENIFFTLSNKIQKISRNTDVNLFIFCVS